MRLGGGASGFTLCSGAQVQLDLILLSHGSHEIAVLLTTSTVRAFSGALPPTTPSADFRAAVRPPCDGLSPVAGTQRRSPEVRPTAFTARPPDLPPRSLITVDFAISSSLVRPGRPLVRCLSIGPRLCSTLSSDPTSRRRPCASLILRRHQAGQRTSTSKLSFILGTLQKAPAMPGLELPGFRENQYFPTTGPPQLKR
jgi:hypothetical protein